MSGFKEPIRSNPLIDSRAYAKLQKSPIFNGFGDFPKKLTTGQMQIWASADNFGQAKLPSKLPPNPHPHTERNNGSTEWKARQQIETGSGMVISLQHHGAHV
jgi:hypothetical protein